MQPDVEHFHQRRSSEPCVKHIHARIGLANTTEAPLRDEQAATASVVVAVFAGGAAAALDLLPARKKM